MNCENISTFTCDLMTIKSFTTLSTVMKKQYFIEKYQYIFGKKFRRDVYVPNKLGDDKYPVFGILKTPDFEPDIYDYSFKKFITKKLHNKYLDEDDTSWICRYQILTDKKDSLWISCIRKKRRNYEVKLFNKYGCF
tara:strand:+ start:166 stop:573 length:408 start_codon:yes stop_codon:yes gene_type:complete